MLHPSVLSFSIFLTKLIIMFSLNPALSLDFFLVLFVFSYNHLSKSKVCVCVLVFLASLLLDSLHFLTLNLSFLALLYPICHLKGNLFPLLTILLTPIVWGCSHTSLQLWIPTGYLTIQFWHYLELARPHRSRALSHKSAPQPGVSPRSSPVLLTN